MPRPQDRWAGLELWQKASLWIRATFYVLATTVVRLRWAIRHREFWEEITIYAKPHIIGKIAIVAVALFLYPAEFAAGVGLGAITGSAVTAVNFISGKG